MSVQTPAWVKRAVFYQIFPDRFARSPRMKHARGLQFKPWGSPPAEQGFQGGDLLGVVDKLDYLADLGVTALYLNPVFASAANHRYHTYDYLHVDPLLGGNAALAELIEAAHRRDMRIVLDGVFNHASRGFWAFHHILENGPSSPYLDWFHIRDWPLRPYDNPDNLPINYDAWWGIPGLPKFNIQNPGVRDYLLKVAEYWVQFGIDGWRLDVPEEINDPPFWQDFRRVVKAANPEAYIVGEIWHEAHEWLQGDRFDAVMNYIFSRAAYGFFAADTMRMDYKPGGYPLIPLNAITFARIVERMLGLYDWEIVQSQLNLLDSHDTGRTLWIANSDESALRLCALFQMTMPGAPCIYYGDEIGMTGGPDPDCRRAFPWHEEMQWNGALRDFYRRAIHLRHRYPVFSIGRYRTLTVTPSPEPHPHIYAFRRGLDEQTAIVVFNVGRHPATVNLAAGMDLDGRLCVNIWGKERYTVQQGELAGVHIPPRDACILMM